MLQIRIISPTNKKVVWPTADADFLAQAKTYLTYETSLPAGQQQGGLSAAVLQAQVDAVEAADEAAKSAEETRAYQANVLANVIEELKPKIAQATLALKTRHFGTEAIMEQWGYISTVGKDGKINIRQPSKPQDIVTFMAKYTAKESGMIEGEEITTPSLAEMNALNATLQDAAKARDEAQAEREAAVDRRGRETRKLAYLMQLACGMRVMLTYQGLITNDLENWGFMVVDPAAPSTEGENGTGEPPETV